MADKPISPVIVTFKALPGVRLQAVHGYSCRECRLPTGDKACIDEHKSKNSCVDLDYIWREVGEK